MPPKKTKRSVCVHLAHQAEIWLLSSTVCRNGSDIFLFRTWWFPSWFCHVYVHNKLVPSIVNSCRMYRFFLYLKRYIRRAVYWKIVFPAACGINFFLLCQRAIVVSSLVCINVDRFVIICHNLDSGKTLQNIYCLWTNMAEIWPSYFQINFLKNHFWEFWVLFSVLVIFFPGCTNDLVIAWGNSLRCEPEWPCNLDSAVFGTFS